MYLNEVGIAIYSHENIGVAKQRAEQMKNRGYMVLFEQTEFNIQIKWCLTSDQLVIN